MSFPEKTFLGFPKDWEDRGDVAGEYLGNNIERFRTCGLCKTIARVGIDEDKLRFLYCSKCIKKLT